MSDFKQPLVSFEHEVQLQLVNSLLYTECTAILFSLPVEACQGSLYMASASSILP